MSITEAPPAPWHAFLTDLDDALTSVAGLDCIGGFVVNQLYGLARETADLDFIELASVSERNVLLTLGRRDGPLCEKHRVYLDPVTISSFPEEYESRLVEMYSGVYKHLRLLALDRYDLALTKLERNSQKDRDDVRFLARTIPLDLEVLRARYRTEMRESLMVPAREDLTLELWIDMINDDRSEP